MNVFSLVGRMTTAKYATWKAGPPAKPVHTPSPLSLSQGSTVEISVVPGILAQAAGSVFPETTPNQSVVSVGKMELFGFKVTRSYLSDGRSFIETVADKASPFKSVQTRLYSLHTERQPSQSSELEFLLGGAAKTMLDSNTGETIVIQEATPALIGWPAFQLENGEAHVLYDRVWSPGSNPIEPQQATEILYDAAGGSMRVEHRMMSYSRTLGDVTEYLMAEFIETDDGAAFNASVGLAFDETTLKVLAPA